jgi:hypothetical protein
MPVTIPCDPSLTSYVMQTVLDGITYTLAFHWNTREEAWYFDIQTADRTPLVSGIKIVVGFPLGFRTPNANKPPGLFTAVDTTGKKQDPGIADLGNRVKLLYLSEDETRAGIADRIAKGI